jgi:lysophospholipase L1-like esterase
LLKLQTTCYLTLVKNQFISPTINSAMKVWSATCLGVGLLFAVSAFGKPPVKIICISAINIYTVGSNKGEQASYLVQLQRMLGNNYLLHRYGATGATVLGKGDVPYKNTTAYRDALQTNPDIVLIDLGGNDSKLVNRKYIHEFENDYHLLIKSFSQLASHPRIILLLPIPSFAKDSTGIWDPVTLADIIPHIRQVAYDENIEVIDIHSLLVDKEAWMPDKINPGKEGAVVMAKRLYDLILTITDPGFDVFNGMKKVEKSRSSFYGYSCTDFMYNGSACKIVKPRGAAVGHPWVWRARFWGHEPQTDIALLERGFHIVYCDVAELYGNSEAIAKWNSFYAFATKAGLAQKAVMEGMSRGGVYVFNWAAVNPAKVACVYVDNPVLDLKSWPGGKGKGPGSANDWEIFKKDYGYTTEEAAMDFSGSPVNKAEQIVKGKYPILILCADADEAVPADENTIPFEQKIKALNGNITVIYKRGFKHHPHSLPNPAPIVDFILKAAGYYIPAPGN